MPYPSRALLGLILICANVGCGTVAGPGPKKDAADQPDQPDAAVSKPPADSSAPLTPDAPGPDGPGQTESGSDGPAHTPDVATPVDVRATLDAPSAAPDTSAPAPDTSAPAPDTRPAPDADLRCPGAVPPGNFDLVCGCNGGGKIRCDGTCSEVDDTCVPTGQWYHISNMFQGEARVLDTYGGPPPNGAFINAPCCSGGNWTITAAGDKHYRLTNEFLGAPRSLEAKPDGSGLIMGNTGDLPAQLWSIRAVGGGWFRITNKLLGPGRSLDTPGDMKDRVYMPPTANYSGQFWRFKKLP